MKGSKGPSPLVLSLPPPPKLVLPSRTLDRGAISEEELSDNEGSKQSTNVETGDTNRLRIAAENPLARRRSSPEFSQGKGSGGAAAKPN